jgi:hypothetical protein
MRRRKTHICKIKNEKGEITTSNRKSREIRDNFENLYSSKLENLEEMNKFLGRYDQSKLNQEGMKSPK